MSPRRSSRPDERRPGNRLPRKRLLIVCEGQQTEPNYFEALRKDLRLNSSLVEVEGLGRGHQTLVEYADKRKRTERDFDEVWCVFDAEAGDKRQEFMAAFDMARRRGIYLAISNPAFEYWYLLHFVETSQPFSNGAEVKRRLSRPDCIPNYEENCDAFSCLSGRLERALERADSILKQLHREDDPFPNPSTGVHVLVKTLLAMQERW